MGFEVSRRRVYGPQDTYCNGSGLSVLVSDLDEANRYFDAFAMNDAAYPSAAFLVDLSADKVLRQTGPSRAEVDRAMNAAWHRSRRTS